MGEQKHAVELFHLLFLDQLSRKLDKKLYAVKGGCNLRFFFKSIRYSEDLDVDVHTIATHTLTKKIEQLITSRALQVTLHSHGLTILQHSHPKQTQTTQRWKITLQSKQSTVLLNTKIEFSRRKFHEQTCFEAIDASITSLYQLPPILANHYSPTIALQQKIEALIGRSQTQTRDVFDLYHLIALGALENPLPAPMQGLQDNIAAALSTLAFEDFKSQVVAFLPPEYQPSYNDPSLWGHIKHRVLSALQKANYAPS